MPDLRINEGDELTTATTKRKPAAKKAAAKPRVKKPAPLATEVSVTMPATTLANALKNALISTDRSGLRPVLAAALFEFPPNMIRIVSTDSYSLLVQEMPRDDKTAAASVLVSRADLMMWERLLRLLPKPKKPAAKSRSRWAAKPVAEIAPQMATVKATPERVELNAEHLGATAVPLSYEFPNWQKLVDAQTSTDPPTSGCAVDATKIRALAGLVSLNGVTSPYLTLTPQDALKPLRLSWKQGEGYKIEALLMPVRVS